MTLQVIHGDAPVPALPGDIKNEIHRLAESCASRAHKQSRSSDPENTARIHKNNRRRMHQKIRLMFWPPQHAAALDLADRVFSSWATFHTEQGKELPPFLAHMTEVRS